MSVCTRTGTSPLRRGLTVQPLVTGLSFWALVLAMQLRSSAGYPTFKEKFYHQLLDHFNPAQTQRWSQRYLFNDDFWDGRGRLLNGCVGPILLYTGNEGDVEAFWSGNGFMVEVLAPRLGGLLVFPEERFYGKSLPFGSDSLQAEHLVYLTTAQVLEDYVEIINHVKASLPGSGNCPVVAFGGSYGGTLAALLRASHPASVVGGLAASSELGYYDVDRWSEHGVDQFTFEDIVVKDYEDAHPRCLQMIQAATRVIENTDTHVLMEKLKLCDAQALGSHRKSDLFIYALEALPQQNYPYKIGEMPAKPVSRACDLLVHGLSSSKDHDSLLSAVAEILQMGLGVGNASCIPAQSIGGPGNTPGDGPGPSAWGWQSCTETLHQFSAHVLRNYSFDISGSAALCARVFNGTVTPDLSALARSYGGYALADGTAGVRNLIWSQGTLDPWHGWFNGISEPATGSEVHHFLLKDAAHHLDLRSPNSEDPPSVTKARSMYIQIISRWIQEASAQQVVLI